MDQGALLPWNTWLKRSYYSGHDTHYHLPRLSRDEAWRRVGHVLLWDAHFWGDHCRRHGPKTTYPNRHHLILRHSKDFKCGQPQTVSDLWLTCLPFLHSDKEKKVILLLFIFIKTFPLVDCI